MTWDSDDEESDSDADADLDGSKCNDSSDEEDVRGAGEEHDGSEEEDVAEEDQGPEEDGSQMYTGSTMSVSEQAFLEKEKQCHQLTSEVDTLRNCVMELRHSLGMRKKGSVGSGKNKTRRKKETQTLTDKLNSSHVNQYWKKVVWPYVKILDKRWPKWSTKAGSVCERVMKLVTVPHLMSDKEYWYETVCGFINDKNCALRSGLKEDVKKQYNGMYSCCKVYFERDIPS